MHSKIRILTGHRFCLLIGSFMIALGISLFLAVTALYAYGAYERYRFEQSAMELVAEEAVESGPIAELEATTSSQADQGSVNERLIVVAKPDSQG